jgi:hypothetical protein
MGDLNNIPSVYSRADGIGGNLGTYTDPKLVALNYAQGLAQSGQTTIFEEASDSPKTEMAEQWTITHRFYVDYYTGQLLQTQYYRGYLMTDNAGNVSRVLSTDLVPMAKTNVQVCLFTVVSEGTNWGNPPDEFSITKVDLNPVAEKHPRYSGLSYLQRYQIRQMEVGDFFTSQQMMNMANSISISSSATPAQKNQALELLYKKFKGEDTFYLSAFQVQFSQYYWKPQIINPGGYIEDPILSGNIPTFFVGTGDVGNISTIFSEVAQHNPNLFPNYNSLTNPPYGLSWLRMTDEQSLNRTWWKVTRTWVGAPIGQWDNTWYNGNQFNAYQTSSLQGGIYVLPI